MKELPVMLTEKDAAKLIGGSHWTLRKWRSKGEGPVYHKRGGRVFYNLKDLETWMVGVRIDPASSSL